MQLTHLLTSATLFASALSAAVYTSEYTTLGCPASTMATATVTQQYEAMLDFTNLLYSEKRGATAMDKYVALHLINHASEVAGDGRQLAIDTVVPMLNAGTTIIHNVFVGQDMAATYFQGIMGNSSVAAYDQFRMSGTCLVEHWVIEAPITESSNPHPYF